MKHLTVASRVFCEFEFFDHRQQIVSVCGNRYSQK